jgi:hypothetical protein
MEEMTSCIHRELPNRRLKEVGHEEGTPRGRWRGVTELVSATALLDDLGHVIATPGRTSFQSSESMLVSAGRGCSFRGPPPPNFWMFLPVSAIKHSGASRALMRALRPRIEKEKEIGEAV